MEDVCASDAQQISILDIRSDDLPNFEIKKQSLEVNILESPRSKL